VRPGNLAIRRQTRSNAGLAPISDYTAPALVGSCFTIQCARPWPS
jgi:hypothetical protein